MKKRVLLAVAITLGTIVLVQGEALKAAEFNLNHTDTEMLGAMVESSENESYELLRPAAKSVEETLVRDLDIHILAKAVAHAETGNGKTGSWLTHNNLCGQMGAHYENGVRIREYFKYDSYEHSLRSCKWLLANGPTWADKHYSEMTIEEMAGLYSGEDRVHNWSSNVLYWYKKYKGIS